jgi:hypothetical protein
MAKRVALLTECFQLGDGLEIPRLVDSAFHFHEFFEIEAIDLPALEFIPGFAPR